MPFDQFQTVGTTFAMLKPTPCIVESVSILQDLHGLAAIVPFGLGLQDDAVSKGGGLTIGVLIQLAPVLRTEWLGLVFPWGSCGSNLSEKMQEIAMRDQD